MTSNNEDLKSKTISGLLFKLLERGGRAVIELALQIVLARLLSPTEFGTLAVMLVFINVGNVVVQSGLNTALVQNPKVKRKDYSTVFWMSFAISCFLYFVVFVAAPMVASFYSNEDITFALRVLAFCLIAGSLVSVQTAIVQRAMQFKKIMIATIVAISASGILGIIFAVAGAGIWALIIQQLSYYVINGFVLSVQTKWHPVFVFERRRAWSFFRYGWKILAASLLDTSYQSASDLIIGKQFGADVLGFVSQGKKYPHALGSMLDGAIQPVMLSAVSHIQNDIGRVKQLVRRALKTSCFLIFPSMLLFAVCAPEVVYLLLGEKWAACVPFMQMYCLTYAMLPIHTTNLQAINGLGRSDIFLKLEVIKKIYGMVLLLIAAFVFRDVYLMIGSYIVIAIISTFINTIPNKKLIGYSYLEQMKDIMPSLIIALIAAGAAYFAGSLITTPILSLGIEIIVMFLVYLLLARCFKLEAFQYLIKTIRSKCR